MIFSKTCHDRTAAATIFSKTYRDRAATAMTFSKTCRDRAAMDISAPSVNLSHTSRLVT
jgi:hypothetical protein